MLQKYIKSDTPEYNIHNTFFVARPGIVFILLSMLLTILVICLEISLCKSLWILRDIFIVLTVLVIWFFRDPHRPTPPGEFGLSPADGRVIRLDKDSVNPFTGEPALKVSIFMNLFSVHVNRVPLSGTLKSQIYHKGALVNASFDKASENNERNVLVIEDEKGREFAMVQVAGLVARRIVSWVNPGDKLIRGQRFGMIRFGSRLDLYLPQNSIPMVALGQEVKAGWSPVWSYPEK